MFAGINFSLRLSGASITSFSSNKKGLITACGHTKEHKLQEKYTSSEIIQTLRSMNLRELEGIGYIPAYTRTSLTDELHKVFKFRTDYEITILKNMKKIFYSTKKK